MAADRRGGEERFNRVKYAAVFRRGDPLLPGRRRHHSFRVDHVAIHAILGAPRNKLMYALMMRASPRAGQSADSIYRHSGSPGAGL